jgi:hypothetical protein
LLRILLSRAVLAAVPFAIYFAWHLYLKSTGRETRPPPWGWLIAAAGVLVGVSLIVTVAITPSNLGRHYVPAQTKADGSITPGHYE